LQKPHRSQRPTAAQPPIALEAAPEARTFDALEEVEPPVVEELVPKEPDIKVKTILKRPASTPSNLGATGAEASEDDFKNAVKSLKEREEDYAKVRLRILGSAGTASTEAAETASSD
jgi:hypothetical protein